MRVLVLGRSGQLAQALSRLRGNDITIDFGARPDLDLLRLDDIEPFIVACTPDVVINAAAYTRVDAAEEDEAQAHLLNALAPEAAAHACRRIGARFVHVSTDYVFDGEKDAPYAPSDPIAPQNAYGRTKAEGEARVREAHDGAQIIRTSWVFDSQGANFLRTMLRLAETRPTVRVVNDQIGGPTWSRDLAAACLAAARAGPPGGLYHYAGAGDASWADFAQAIFAEAGRRGLPTAQVERIATHDFPTAARRPANSRLDSSAFAARFGVKPRPWREALALCMDEIAHVR